MKIENVAVISLEDYAEYLELKREKQSAKHRIDGCLMDDCNKFNYKHKFDPKNYHSYKLISKGYGTRDVFKAKDLNGDDVIFFGEWVD